MKFETAFIHIGMEKTGSTSIQAFLAENRSRLKEQNFLFPRTLGNDNQKAIAAYALSYDSKDSALKLRNNTQDKESVDAFRVDLRTRFLAEAAESDAKNLVVSSEDLSRLFKHDEIERIKDFFDGVAQTVKIIVYVRRQDLLASSRFYTLLLGRRPQQKVLPDKSTPISPIYQYNKNIMNWAKVFGTDAISLVRYPEMPSREKFDSIDFFCTEIGLNPEGLRRPGRANESVDSINEIIFRNFFLAERGGPLSYDIEQLKARLQPFNEKKYKFLVSGSAAEKFYMRVHKENVALFKALGLPEDTFSLDFSMYPTPKTVQSYNGIAMQRLLRIVDL